MAAAAASLAISVSHPVKHGDGVSAFISYKVNTKVREAGGGTPGMGRWRWRDAPWAPCV